MPALREQFLETAEATLPLLRAPEVARCWDLPSALAEFSVRGLAGHLASQVFNVSVVLAEPLPQPPVPAVSLLDHYGRVAWRGAEVDTEVNMAIRAGGERLAVDGAGALADRFAASIAALRPVLLDEPADRVVFVPWAGWPLTLDDFLVTRMMELAVHGDDLATSAGVAAAPLPPEALAEVLRLLTGLAVRRHGQAAVLRALSRAERAPERINAI